MTLSVSCHSKNTHDNGSGLAFRGKRVYLIKALVVYGCV